MSDLEEGLKVPVTWLCGHVGFQTTMKDRRCRARFDEHRWGDMNIQPFVAPLGAISETIQ